MKPLTRRMLVMAIAMALIVSAVVLVRHRKAALAHLEVPQILPIPVHIKTAESGTRPRIEHYLGTLEARESSRLSAQVSGYVTDLSGDVGDTVVQGDSLGTVDARLQRHQKDALFAELAGAREDVRTKKTMLERRRQLYKESAISKESLDEADLAYEAATARVNRLNQEYEASNVSLSFTRLVSPFSGIITERLKDPGDLVMPGTPIFAIENRDKGYKILASVPQETALNLSTDNSVRLSHGDRSLDVNGLRIYPAISSGHLVTVEIRVPQRPFGLPTGSTVGVDLIMDLPEGVIVSTDCILEQGTGSWVFVVDDSNQVRPVCVTVLGRNQGQAVLAPGLPDGAKLASGPESMLLQLSKGRGITRLHGGEK